MKRTGRRGKEKHTQCKESKTSKGANKSRQITDDGDVRFCSREREMWRKKGEKEKDSDMKTKKE